MSLPVTQNILNCFDDLITLDGCDNVVSTLGRTMMDVGITKHELDQYINKEYQSGTELFNDKKSFSIAIIANQIHSHLQAYYRAKTLIDGLRVGFIQDNKEAQPNTGTSWLGQEINIKNNTSFLELFISEVSLFVNYTGDIDIRIYDLKTGNILKDASGKDFVFTMTSIAGEVATVYPQIQILSSKKEVDLAFIYNSTGVTPYKVALHSDGCLTCNPCNSTRYTDVYGISIPNGSGIIKRSITHQGYTGGMSIVYSLNCNTDQWLCSISNLLSLPLLYKTASELMNYALNNSDQMNPKTLSLFNAEKIQKRMDQYEFQYREALDNIINKIVIPKDSVCFTCNKRIIRTTTIP
jgi:hypothetical protein